MTILVGKDGQPIASDRAKDEASKELEELEGRKKIYRLHPDVAMLCQDIISLSMMSVGISQMDTINAGKTMCDIMLEESSSDPTGTTMTINSEWYDEFKQNMEGAFAVVQKHLADNKAAEDAEAAEEECPF